MNRFTLLILFAFVVNTGMAHVILNYPEGGETFVPGQEIVIEWEELVQHNTENWDLYFSLNGGESWQELAIDLDYEMRTFNWVIPEMPTSEARIKVIQDNTGFDYEDESPDFTITEQVVMDEIAAADFKVYPNPATDFIVIHPEATDDAEIKIHNLSGHLIKRISLQALPNENYLKIDLSGLKSGLYFITIQSTGKIKTQKLFIE